MSESEKSKLIVELILIDIIPQLTIDQMIQFAIRDQNPYLN